MLISNICYSKLFLIIIFSRSLIASDDINHRKLTSKSYFKYSNKKDINNITESGTNLLLSCNNDNAWPKLNLFLTARISVTITTS